MGRYYQLYLERRGVDIHRDQPDEAKGLEAYMSAKDLERIDREIARAEKRIQVLIDLHPSFTEKGFRALTMEQEANDIEDPERVETVRAAHWMREEARLLRAECEAAARYLDEDKQLLAGLRLEKAAKEKEINHE